MLTDDDIDKIDTSKDKKLAYLVAKQKASRSFFNKGGKYRTLGTLGIATAGVRSELLAFKAAGGLATLGLGAYALHRYLKNNDKRKLKDKIIKI